MVRASFTANLQRHVSCPAAAVGATTVREAPGAMFANNSPFRFHVVDEHGRLRKHVNCFVNDRPASDRARLSDAVTQ